MNTISIMADSVVGFGTWEDYVIAELMDSGYLDLVIDTKKVADSLAHKIIGQFPYLRAGVSLKAERDRIRVVTENSLNLDDLAIDWDNRLADAGTLDVHDIIDEFGYEVELFHDDKVRAALVEINAGEPARDTVAVFRGSNFVGVLTVPPAVLESYDLAVKLFAGSEPVEWLDSFI